MTRLTGRRPAIADSRVPLMAAHMPFESLPPPKKFINWHAAVGAVPMLMNQTRGNCVIATLGHWILQMTTLQGEPREMTDDEADSAYQAVNNWTPSAADQVGPGTYVLGPNGLVQYWRTRGITVGGKMHRCGPAARINLANRAEIAQAIDVFGGIWWGLNLHQRASDAAFLWDDAGGDLVGGHEVLISGMEELDTGYRVYDVLTWDGKFRVTEDVFNALGQEAIAFIDTDDIAARGHDPADVPIAELEAMMSRNFEVV